MKRARHALARLLRLAARAVDPVPGPPGDTASQVAWSLGYIDARYGRDQGGD